MSNHTPDDPNSMNEGSSAKPKPGIRKGLRNLKRRILGDEAYHEEDRVRFETLEPRLLYSASPVPVNMDEPLAVDEAPAEIASEAVPVTETQTAVMDAPATLAPGDFVDQSMLDDIASVAAQRWAEAGLSEEQLETLSALQYRVEDLGEDLLASSHEYEIVIDDDAAGLGWFLDATPEADEEFGWDGDRLVALEGDAADGVADLLSVVMEEQGRILGVLDSLGTQSEVRAGTFETGQRLVPSQSQTQGSILDGDLSAGGYLAGTIDSLSLSELEALADAAAQRWADTGLNADQLAALEQISYRIEDLSGNVLGKSRQFEIVLDSDAGGNGWFVDGTPLTDEEFLNGTGPEGIDLLTVLMHEQGHVLGLDDIRTAADQDNLMYGFLSTGERRSPLEGQAEGAIAGAVESYALMGSTLNAGDIVIIGMNADDPDSFAFMPLIDLADATEIHFTDKGWDSTGGALSSGEGTVTWTASGTVKAGTVITISNDGGFSASIGGVVATGSFDLETTGDQILAYQGAEATPTFIYAVNNNGTATWSNATDTNTSALPNGLVDGMTAVALTEIDNTVFLVPPQMSGTQAQLQQAVSDSDRWTGSDTSRQIFPFAAQVVTGGAGEFQDSGQSLVDQAGMAY